MIPHVFLLQKLPSVTGQFFGTKVGKSSSIEFVGDGRIVARPLGVTFQCVQGGAPVRERVLSWFISVQFYYGLWELYRTTYYWFINQQT